jgi:hypothetical protein
MARKYTYVILTSSGAEDMQEKIDAYADDSGDSWRVIHYSVVFTGDGLTYHALLELEEP